MGEANENLTSVKGGVLVLNGSWFVFESLVSLILGFFFDWVTGFSRCL